jgi:hypothetical protein
MGEIIGLTGSRALVPRARAIAAALLMTATLVERTADARAWSKDFYTLGAREPVLETRRRCPSNSLYRIC